MSVIGIILGVFFLGWCIFVHELGHFLAAKWRGLHIVAFSIGFKKVWGFKHKGIDYRIGCIPCGGYVDLPQIDATGEPKDEHGNPLPPAKPIDRIITAFAGPFFNILFGIFLSLFVWWIGVPQDTPNMQSITVETIEKNSPEYKAGLRVGDEITKINGKKFNYTWSDFVRQIIFTVGDVTLTVTRDDKPFDISYKPIPNEKRTPNEKIAYPFFMPKLPLECEVPPGSHVEKAGMETEDIIIELNGKKMADVEELRNALSLNQGEEIVFTVKRDGKTIKLAPIKPIIKKSEVYRTGMILSSLHATVTEVDPKTENDITDFKTGDRIRQMNGLYVSGERQLQSIIKKKKGQPITFQVKRKEKQLEFAKTFPEKTPKDASKLKIKYAIGTPIWIVGLLPGAPAEKQGFQKYDQLIKLNDKPIKDSSFFIDAITKSKGKPLKIELNRDGKVLQKDITPVPFNDYIANDIGLRLVLTSHPTPTYQFTRVISMTYNSLRGIFSKESTLKTRHLSGPLGIFRGIGLTFSKGGIMPVLALIVLITYSLALLNIMPLPVLDGGHIVLALIEQIVGKPLSPKIVQPLFVIFVMLLISMMVYVTFYDILRLTPRNVTSVTKEYHYLASPPEAKTLK